MAAEKKVADVLAEVFRRGGMKRPLQRARLVIMWPRIAGPELSRFTKASSFRDGVLFVDTTDSETAMHLGLQRARFISGFHAQGARELKDIRFRPGRIAQPEAEAVRLTSEPAAVDLEPLQGALASAVLPDEVRLTAAQAASGIARTRTQRRQLGWSPCVVCGSLGETGPLCLTCRRYSETPGTQRAARQLMTAPEAATPWLTDGQREVAAWLAAGELTVRMKELLPQVISDQRLLPQLELLAVNWLVLHMGKPAAEHADSDWLLLPEAVGRVLGRR